MKLNSIRSSRGPLLVIGLTLSLTALVGTRVTSAQEAPVNLGTTESFAVLAGSGVTNTGPTGVSGNLGSCPTPAITGFPPGTVSNGTIHAADAVCLQAQSDLTIAYLDAAGRAPTTTYPGVKDLGGETLPPGVYKADAFAITGTLTLDAQGDPNAVWIFQAGSTLITAPNSRVVLINGAQPCNVFWQVGSSATLGVGSTFIGTILALTSITANTNAIVQGRLLARNGAVTLDSNTVTRPMCAPTPTTTSSTTSSSTTVLPTTTSSTTTVAPTTTSSTTVSPTTTSSTTTVSPTTTSSTTVSPTTTSSTIVPPITLPPVTLPPVTLPPVTLPPVTLPPIGLPPVTVPDITLPPLTVPDITLAPTTTSTSTTLPATTTTTSSTVAPETTTTTSLGDTGLVIDTGATTTTSSPSTTTTVAAATTTIGAAAGSTSGTFTTTTTTPSAGSSADGGGTATATTAGGVAGAAAAGTLVRTGSSLRATLWAVVALASGGVMVLVAGPQTPGRSRRRSTGS